MQVQRANADNMFVSINEINTSVCVYKHNCKLLVLRRVLHDFSSQSDYSNLTDRKYFKKHFIKIVPTDCFAYAAHQETQHFI